MKLLVILLGVLSSFLANLETKVLRSEFTVTIAEDVDAPLNYPGAIVMQGNLFRLNIIGFEAAYDGETMYLYSDDTYELTMSNPTEQELREANPLLFAKSLVDVCHIVERKSQDGQQTIITLTPKDQRIGINRFTLRIRTSDLMPLKIEIKEGKKITTLKMKDPKFEEVLLAPSEFRLQADNNTYINDMRL